jgi:proline dehydrogenase
MYRHDRIDFLEKSYNKATIEKYILGAKLVRGAYMEKERERAQEKGYTSPIQIDKEHTDIDYDKAVKYCLEHANGITLFVGTHNENSCMQATVLMDNLKIEKKSTVYFSQLYGMSDNISFNLSKSGYLVSKYLPYGPIRDVIPYLMRRAQENTSVAGQTGRELKLINKELERRNKSK